MLDPAWMRLKERLGLAAGSAAAPDRARARPTSVPADFAAHPAAELLRTLRERTRASGARVVFYVPPVPPAGVGSPDGDPVGIAHRIERLRVALGAADDEWLDLHDGAPPALFLDASGHLRTSGCGLVGRPIAARVLPALGR